VRGVLQRVACVAATDATVLVTGETGTGKECQVALLRVLQEGEFERMVAARRRT
jgi:transcriptional regulator with GAF, ATPase, and Fis domain